MREQGGQIPITGSRFCRIKKSGIGREFSKYSLLGFANIKSVIVA